MEPWLNYNMTKEQWMALSEADRAAKLGGLQTTQPIVNQPTVTPEAMTQQPLAKGPDYAAMAKGMEVKGMGDPISEAIAKGINNTTQMVTTGMTLMNVGKPRPGGEPTNDFDKTLSLSKYGVPGVVGGLIMDANETKLAKGRFRGRQRNEKFQTSMQNQAKSEYGDTTGYANAVFRTGGEVATVPIEIEHEEVLVRKDDAGKFFVVLGSDENTRSHDKVHIVNGKKETGALVLARPGDQVFNNDFKDEVIKAIEKGDHEYIEKELIPERNRYIKVMKSGNKLFTRETNKYTPAVFRYGGVSRHIGAMKAGKKRSAKRKKCEFGGEITLDDVQVFGPGGEVADLSKSKSDPNYKFDASAKDVPMETSVKVKDYSDAKNFGQAFAQARKEHGGKGGVFEWKGKKYTTDYAEENPALAAASARFKSKGKGNGKAVSSIAKDNETKPFQERIAKAEANAVEQVNAEKESAETPVNPTRGKYGAKNFNRPSAKRGSFSPGAFDVPKKKNPPGRFAGAPILSEEEKRNINNRIWENRIEEMRWDAKLKEDESEYANTPEGRKKLAKLDSEWRVKTDKWKGNINPAWYEMYGQKWYDQSYKKMPVKSEPLPTYSKTQLDSIDTVKDAWLNNNSFKPIDKSAVRVLDGDTYSINGQSRRLNNTAAPEKDQYGSVDVKKRLEHFLSSPEYSVYEKELGKDKFGRSITAVVAKDTKGNVHALDSMMQQNAIVPSKSKYDYPQRLPVALNTDGQGKSLYPETPGLSWGSKESSDERNARLLNKSGAKAKGTKAKNQYGYRFGGSVSRYRFGGGVPGSGERVARGAQYEMYQQQMNEDRADGYLQRKGEHRYQSRKRFITPIANAMINGGQNNQMPTVFDDNIQGDPMPNTFDDNTLPRPKLSGDNRRLPQPHLQGPIKGHDGWGMPLDGKLLNGEDQVLPYLYDNGLELPMVDMKLGQPVTMRKFTPRSTKLVTDGTFNPADQQVVDRSASKSFRSRWNPTKATTAADGPELESPVLKGTADPNFKFDASTKDIPMVGPDGTPLPGGNNEALLKGNAPDGSLDNQLLDTNGKAGTGKKASEMDPNYAYFANMAGVGFSSWMRNALQNDPPSLNLKEINLRRYKFDRTPYEATRSRIESAQSSAMDTARKQVGQGSDAVAAISGINANTNDALNDVAIQEGQALQQVKNMNTDIANQEAGANQQIQNTEIAGNLETRIQFARDKRNAMQQSEDFINQNTKAFFDYNNKKTAVGKQEKVQDEYLKKQTAVDMAAVMSQLNEGFDKRIKESVDTDITTNSAALYEEWGKEFEKDYSAAGLIKSDKSKMTREEITKLQSDATTPEDKTKYTELLTKYDEVDSKVTNSVKERINKYRSEREAYHRQSILESDPTLKVLKTNFPEYFQ